MMSDDIALVREYAQSNSEQAFTALVSRHVNLVYSVALRQVRDPHLAEEISQAVFVILSKKAKSLDQKTILPGWLCRTARYVSAHELRNQRRRQLREQESQMQSALNEPEHGAWEQIAPWLNEALNCLGEKEHDAVVLRFLDGKELKQVGAAMGTTEDAARMRVNRGLEKLRKFFTNKGVTLSTTAIAGAVAANSIQAAPTGLAATITSAALSGMTITSSPVIAASKGIAMTTLQKTVITTALAIAVGTGIYEARQAASARAEMQRLQQQQGSLIQQVQALQQERDKAARLLAALRSDLERLNRDTVELAKLRGEVTTLHRQNENAQASQRENVQRSATEWASYSQQEENVFNDMKEMVKGFRRYGTEHNGGIATNFDQLTTALTLRTNQDGSRTVLPSGTGVGNFEFMNVGLANETTPQLVIFREKNPRSAPGGEWGRIYGFADGTVVKRRATDQDFAIYENQLTLEGRLIEPTKSE